MFRVLESVSGAIEAALLAIQLAVSGGTPTKTTIHDGVSANQAAPTGAACFSGVRNDASLVY